MIYEFGEMVFDYSINSNGGRTNEKPAAWDWLNLAHRKAASDACAKIISLRKTYPTAFTTGTFTLSIGLNDWNSGRRIALTSSDLNMIALGNFNASATITATPNFPKTGIWYNLLTGEQLNVSNTTMTMSMQAGDLLIYTDKAPNVVNGIDDHKISNYSISPTITEDKVYITSSGGVNHVNVYNTEGSLIKTATNVTEIEVRNFPKGIYLLEVKTAEGKSLHKIIKQ